MFSLMVVCFIFVIIGLSLVSMCISVIQASLEDLYKSILMKLVRGSFLEKGIFHCFQLTDYQAKLAQGIGVFLCILLLNFSFQATTKEQVWG
jgi:hypothetical protein